MHMTHPADVLADVWDAWALRPLLQPGRFFSNPNNLALSLFTDGIPIFHSSSTTIWPVYLQILNLPAKIRMQSDNILLPGLWVGPKKPPMRYLLQKVIESLSSLSSSGTTICTSSGPMVVRARIVMGIFDLPAKSSVLCMKQFNGEFGCPTCYHPGRRLANNSRIYLPGTYTERTHSNYMTDTRNAELQKSPVRGIFCRPPIACTLDIVASIPIDYMHALLEGVVKRITTMWFDSAFHLQPFYIGRRVSVVDELLVQQTPPNEFSRPPRSIKKSLKYWKASEFQAWLLFYALPVLIDILPPLYWHHFSLLVCASHILLQEELPILLIDSADKLLADFHQLLPELYGEQACTINAHLLTHLCKFVRLWGPLWTHSTFSFESKNGHLKRTFHAKKIVHSQIVFNVDAIHTLQVLRPQLQSEPTQILEFLDCVSHRSERKNV